MRELKQEDSPISDTFPGFLIVNRTPQQKGPPFSASSPGLWPLTFPQKPQSQALASPPQGSASLEPSHPSFLPRPHQRHSRGTSRGRGGERPPLPRPAAGRGTRRSGRQWSRGCGPGPPSLALPRRRPASLPLPAAGPTRPRRPPSTYPEGVGAIGAAEAPERHAAGSGTAGSDGQQRAEKPGCCWRRRRRRRRGREAAAERAGAATPPDWRARHGDAAAPPRSPRPALAGPVGRLHPQAPDPQPPLH